METFALVDFFERSEVEIVETKYVQTDYDHSRMNRKEWDVNKEVQVPWPVKAKKPIKYVARILLFGASVKELAPYRKAAEEGRAIPLSGEMPCGRGQREKQPKRMWSSDSESKDSDDSTSRQKRKLKNSRQNVTDKARDELQSKLNSVESSEELKRLREEVSSLREEVSSLRKKNMSLQQTLEVIDGLPEILQMMKQLKEKPMSLPPPSPRPELTLPPRMPQHAQAGSPISEPPATPSRMPQPSSKPAQGTPRKILGYEVDGNDKIDLGHGICDGASNLQYVTRANPQKTTYGICEVVCSREEMTSSSVTGKQSNAFKGTAEKKQLNFAKVSAIIDLLQRVHPGTEANIMKKIIAVTLNIAQKLVKRKSEAI